MVPVQHIICGWTTPRPVLDCVGAALPPPPRRPASGTARGGRSRPAGLETTGRVACHRRDRPLRRRALPHRCLTEVQLRKLVGKIERAEIAPPGRGCGKGRGDVRCSLFERGGACRARHQARKPRASQCVYESEGEAHAAIGGGKVLLAIGLERVECRVPVEVLRSRRRQPPNRGRARPWSVSAGSRSSRSSCHDN